MHLEANYDIDGVPAHRYPNGSVVLLRDPTYVSAERARHFQPASQQHYVPAGAIDWENMSGKEIIDKCMQLKSQASGRDMVVELVWNQLDQAMNGNDKVAKALMDRVVPDTVNLGVIPDNPVAQTSFILQQCAMGKLKPADAEKLLTAVTKAAEIHHMQDMAQRLQVIEEALTGASGVPYDVIEAGSVESTPDSDEMDDPADDGDDLPPQCDLI
jgi:hypothetical protein